MARPTGCLWVRNELLQAKATARAGGLSLFGLRQRSVVWRCLTWGGAGHTGFARSDVCVGVSQTRLEFRSCFATTSHGWPPNAQPMMRGFHPWIRRALRALARAESRGECSLLVIRGGDVGCRIALPYDGTTLIGRGRNCAFRLGDYGVSREHCLAIRRDDQVLICDLNSTNGTYLNEIRITCAPLAPDDRLRLGDTVLQLVKQHITRT